MKEQGFGNRPMRGLLRIGLLFVVVGLLLGVGGVIADAASGPARGDVPLGAVRMQADVADVVVIPAKGEVVTSSLVLTSGVRFSVVITGVYRYDVAEGGQLADAQYREDDNHLWSVRWNSVEFDGIGLDAYRGDVLTHTYIYYVLGQGNPLTLRMYDEPGRYGDNTGSLTATIAVVTGSSVFGQVKDEQGNPVAGVIVGTDDLSTTTDTDGQYALYDLPAGAHTISPTLETRAFSPPSITVTVPPDALEQNFTATWAAHMYLPMIARQ
jgi:hypothetical protein